MKRLLSIIGTMNTGGAETFLMKYYRSLDKTKYQIDFAIMNNGTNFYEDEIKKLGGKIFKIVPKSESFIKNYQEVYALVQNQKYQLVMRSGENAANAVELLAAKRAGATKLIFNCTNSKTGNDTLKEKLIHMMFLPLARSIPNIKIGCSANSNAFMFGKKSLKSGKSFVFNNGLMIDDYSFSLEKRKRIRAEYKIHETDVLYGHVGRFSEQKNHDFLLQIFEKIVERQPSSKLILIGDGPLKNTITSQIGKHDLLKKSVIVCGVRSDIPDCLSAMDEFIFPSLYEGLPNAVVEAQAAGLPCIVSDSITKEVKLTGNLYFESLRNTADEWADLCIRKAGKRNENAAEELKESGYDINQVAMKLTELIFGS